MDLCTNGSSKHTLTCGHLCNPSHIDEEVHSSPSRASESLDLSHSSYKTQIASQTSRQESNAEPELPVLNLLIVISGIYFKQKLEEEEF